MTHDPSGEEIPELVDSLEGSLNAPSAAAIHAGLGQRQAARKRILGAAGAFVVVLAVTGAALALTNDDTTETVTADDAALDELSQQIEREPAVADDSAPFEVEGMIRVPSVHGHTIDEAIRILEPEGFAIDIEPISIDDPSASETYVVVEQEPIAFTHAEPGSTVLLRLGLSPLSNKPATVNIHECANGSTITLGSEEWLAWELPQEWAGQGTVQVTVVIDDNRLVATDVNGLTAPFVRDDGQGIVLPCNGFNYEQPSTTPPATTLVVPPTTSLPESTTTTTRAPTGPPSFTPSALPRLSGRWDVVGMWNGSEAVSLTGFGGRIPTITITGRQLSGDDGCNRHGFGVFYPTPDGVVHVQAGRSTSVGCTSGAASLYSSGALRATQWGRTPQGNLALTDNQVVVVFALVEIAPEAELSVDAPLKTIWNSDGPGTNVVTDPPEVTLTIWNSSITNEKFALLDLVGCGQYNFRLNHDGSAEGSAEFVPIEDRGLKGKLCTPSGDGAAALEALAQAEYFAVVDGGVMLWDGPSPLAVFASPSSAS